MQEFAQAFQDLLTYLGRVDPILSSASTLLLGLGIGHELQLGRDKRAEFNKLTADCYVKLRAELDEFPGSVPTRFVDLLDVLVEPHITPLRRRGFRASVLRYRAAITASAGQREDWSGKHNVTGAVRDEAQAAMKALLRHLRPR